MIRLGILFTLLLLSSELLANHCDALGPTYSFDVSRAEMDAESNYHCFGSVIVGVFVEDGGIPDANDSEILDRLLINGSDVDLFVYVEDSEYYLEKYGTLENLTLYARVYNRQLLRIAERRREEKRPFRDAER